MSDRSSFEELLQQNGFLTYKTRGISMNPMLKQNRDLVTVRPFTGRLEKYDIPLYRKTGGGYLLHRIIKVRDNDYVIRGDNTYVKEYVPDDRIVGVLTEFRRKDKTHSVIETGFKAYSRAWNAIYPLRWAMHKTYRTYRKLLKKD